MSLVTEKLAAKFRQCPVSENENVPLGQRLMERPILLLVLGLLVMFVFYTVWGMVEIMTLPEAELP